MTVTTSADVVLLGEIVQAGGLSAAGLRLGLSPASVSQKLSDLERRLGVTLLRRSSRGVRLTKEGESYLSATASIPGLLEEAEEAARASVDPREAPTGLIRLSAPVDLGRQYVAPMVDAFMAEHARVSVRLLLSDEVLDLTKEGVDLTVRYGDMADVSGIATSLLANNHRLVCAAPAYLDRAGRPKTPADLRFHNCLALRTTSRDLSRWSVGRQQVTVQGDRTTHDGGQIREWALRGLGCVYKSFWDVRADLAAGRLEALFQDRTPMRHPLRLARPAGNHAPMRVHRLAEHLRRSFIEEEARLATSST